MKSLVPFLAAALFALPAMAETKYKPGQYDIDAAHSKVGFEISHLVISTVEGKFSKFEGKIDMNEKFEKSKVTVTADVASIDTGVAKRDDHLKSPDFFDAAKYPTIKFVSTEVKGTPESFKLTGNLTIHGVTKKVTFDSKYNGSAVDPYKNEKAGFAGKAKISRKDFGLKWNTMVEAGPVVGDEVTIDLRLEAALAAAPAKK